MSSKAKRIQVKSRNAIAKVANAQKAAPQAAATTQRAPAAQSTQRAPPAPRAITSTRAASVSAGTPRDAGYTVVHEGVPYAGTARRAGRMERRRSGTTLFVKGCERLCAVSQSGAVAQGASLMAGFPNGIVLNPAVIGARLPLEAAPFSKFVFTEVELEYVPTISEANANANGGYIIGVNEDPLAPLPQVSSAGVDAVATWEPNMVTEAVTAASKLRVRLMARDQDELFVDTNGDTRFSSQATIVLLAATDFAAVTQSFGMLFISYTIKLYEPNMPASVPPMVYGTGSAVASGASGDSALTSFTTWWGDQAVFTQVPFSAYGGQFACAGGNTLNQSPYGWMMVYNAMANTAAATFTVVPTLSIVTAGAGASWAAANWGGSLPGPNTRASGIVANNIFGGNTQASNAVYSSVFTWSGGKPHVVNLTHATVSSGTMTVNIMLFRVQIGPVAGRSLPNVLGADGQPLITAAQYNTLQQVQAEVAQADAALTALVADDDGSGLSAADATALDQCRAALCDLPPLTSGAARPLFVGGALASAAAFLLRRYGPKVAAHLLHMGVSRLEAYAAKQHK